MRLRLLLAGLLLSSTTLPAAELRFLALGDSYTIGESVAEAERWPNLLVGALRKRGVAISDPAIIARTGWTTGDLLEAIHQQDPHGPFDLVTVMIGVNNQFQGRPIAEYQSQLSVLLSEATAFAGGHRERVMVISIPDYSVTPLGKTLDPDRSARGVAAFNHVCHHETEQAGLIWIDVTPETQEAATDRSLIAGDGLHPSPKMHAAWVQMIFPHLPPAFSAELADPPSRLPAAAR